MVKVGRIRTEPRFGHEQRISFLAALSLAYERPITAGEAEAQDSG